jgi:ribonuclease I
VSGRSKKEIDVNVASKKAADNKRYSTKNDLPVKSTRVKTEISAISKSELVPTRAYELWLLDGQCHGKDQLHWFQAEREIQSQLNSKGV